ncbi:Hypothetical predicted protein [Lecanosticta acicola]|uniref:Uncharacterized protein n=1 Tax=Lecanosticta acicola TaxID=111012 RepID=A0AAI8Z999_9PEZI|nr:Hypothetical predicted protein [Lecanosticta acicola]
MAAHKYTVARPLIEAWMRLFDSIDEVDGDSLNDLYINKLRWPQGDEEVKNKKNLIAWIRKHFPAKDVKGLQVTQLVKDSMMDLGDAPSKVGDRMDTEPGPSTTVVFQALSISPRQTQIPGTFGHQVEQGMVFKQGLAQAPSLVPAVPTLSVPISMPKLPTARKMPTMAKTPLAPTLITPPFPKSTSSMEARPSTDDHHGVTAQAKSPGLVSSTAANCNLATDPAKTRGNDIYHASSIVTIELDPAFLQEVLNQAIAAHNARNWDAAVASLSNAIAFVLMKKEKDRQQQEEAKLQARSSSTVAIKQECGRFEKTPSSSQDIDGDGAHTSAEGGNERAGDDRSGPFTTDEDEEEL